MSSLSSSARAHWTVQQHSDFKKLTPQKIPKLLFIPHHQQKHRSLIYIESQFKNVLYINIFVARLKKLIIVQTQNREKWSHLRVLKFEWEHFESGNNLFFMFIILSPLTLEQNEHTLLPWQVYILPATFSDQSSPFEFYNSQLHCYTFSYRMNQNNNFLCHWKSI